MCHEIVCLANDRDPVAELCCSECVQVVEVGSVAAQNIADRARTLCSSSGLGLSVAVEVVKSDIESDTRNNFSLVPVSVINGTVGEFRVA